MFVSNESVNPGFLVDDINDLVQIHYDLLSGYESAIPHLANGAYQSVFNEFREHHQQSVVTLAQVVKEYDGQVRKQADLGEALVKARVAFARTESDRAILMAQQVSEQKLDLEYVRDIQSLTSIPGLEEALKRNRVEGIKRLGWLEGELNMLVGLEAAENTHPR